MATLDAKKAVSKRASLMRKLSKRSVEVGWLESARYDDDTPVAYVATIQEFGAPEVKIPPRPFFYPTIEKHGKEWGEIAKRGAQRVLNGQMEPDAVLNSIGGLARGQIQDAISDVRNPPLSPVTVILRAWKKEGMTIGKRSVLAAIDLVKKGGSVDTSNVTDQPLNETGYMIATLTHVLKDK